MSLTNDPLLPGDPIFHPKFGFGTIHGMTRRERVQPVKEPTYNDAQSDHTEDYYDIHLREGGTLLVPISRAEAVGLRRLTGGIDAVKASMYSPVQSLPDDSRERTAVLRLRGQLHEPTALADSVRDLLAQGRSRTLSASEKTWLEKSCQRLSIEVALVDQISLTDAQEAIQTVMRELGMQ